MTVIDTGFRCPKCGAKAIKHPHPAGYTEFICTAPLCGNTERETTRHPEYSPASSNPSTRHRPEYIQIRPEVWISRAAVESVEFRTRRSRCYFKLGFSGTVWDDTAPFNTRQEAAAWLRSHFGIDLPERGKA